MVLDVSFKIHSTTHESDVKFCAPLHIKLYLVDVT